MYHIKMVALALHLHQQSDKFLRLCETFKRHAKFVIAGLIPDNCVSSVKEHKQIIFHGSKSLCIEKRISDQQDERRDQQKRGPCDQIKPERRAGEMVAQKHHYTALSLGYRAICVLVLTHKNAADAWWNPISS